MTNYDRGAYFERQVKADLEADGYHVMRSAGSRGAVDLIALKPGETVLVQCKISGRIGSDAWNDLDQLARDCGAVAVVASRARRGVLGYAVVDHRREPGDRRARTEWRADRVAS